VREPEGRIVHLEDIEDRKRAKKLSGVPPQRDLLDGRKRRDFILYERGQKKDCEGIEGKGESKVGGLTV